MRVTAARLVHEEDGEELDGHARREALHHVRQRQQERHPERQPPLLLLCDARRLAATIAGAIRICPGVAGARGSLWQERLHQRLCHFFNDAVVSS